MSSISIVAAQASHYPSLHHALDQVAAEKRFLATTQAPPYEHSAAFYRALSEGDFPHFVAVQGERVVGWVDVSPVFGQARAHVGVVGIALIPEARHQGLGARLMQAAIDRSWERGLTRLELSVRADNANAKALYERFGFMDEGCQRDACLVDGQYHDLRLMGLLRHAPQA